MGFVVTGQKVAGQLRLLAQRCGSLGADVDAEKLAQDAQREHAQLCADPAIPTAHSPYLLLSR